MRPEVRPNFLFIGPDKAGSTWLYHLLRQHPQVFVPNIKDIYFFDRYYSKGMDWYLSFFEPAGARIRAVGELSHDYLYSREAAVRIREDLPGVKLLTILRSPAERSFSHYLYLVRSGMTRAPFLEAVGNHPAIIDNSRYWKHLRKYFELFDRPQVGVFWFDELSANAERFAEEVLSFLGVDWIEGLEFERRVLPAGRARSRIVARIMKAGANLTRRLGAPRLVGRVKNSAIRDLLYPIYREGEKPEMTYAERAHVIEQVGDDLSQLERELDVDLAHWRVRAGST